jgi:hypothetical protein
MIVIVRQRWLINRALNHRFGSASRAPSQLRHNNIIMKCNSDPNNQQ